MINTVSVDYVSPHGPSNLRAEIVADRLERTGDGIELQFTRPQGKLSFRNPAIYDLNPDGTSTLTMGLSLEACEALYHALGALLDGR